MSKRILFFLMPMLAIALIFTSCDKDSDVVEQLTTEDFIDVEITERSGGTFGSPYGKNRCFQIVFPFTIQFPDSTTFEAVDRVALKEALREWKAANPDATERPSPVFPFTIEYRDGSTQEITNRDEYAGVKETCRELLADAPIRPRPHKTCFNIVYPVTIKFPDNSQVEVASAAEFKQTIREWYTINEGSMERPNIVYPIDVKMKKTGEIVTLNNIDEVQALHRSCRG